MSAPGISYGWLSDVLRDGRYAVRSWTRQRSFTITVLATLVVCLGGNTVIFSLVRSVLLKPLPLASADRLVLVSNLYPRFGFASADQASWPLPSRTTSTGGETSDPSTSRRCTVAPA